MVPQRNGVKLAHGREPVRPMPGPDPARHAHAAEVAEGRMCQAMAGQGSPQHRHVEACVMCHHGSPVQDACDLAPDLRPSGRIGHLFRTDPVHRHVEGREVRPLRRLDQPVAHLAHHPVPHHGDPQLAGAVHGGRGGLEVEGEELHLLPVGSSVVANPQHPTFNTQHSVKASQPPHPRGRHRSAWRWPRSRSRGAGACGRRRCPAPSGPL